VCDHPRTHSRIVTTNPAGDASPQRTALASVSSRIPNTPPLLGAVPPGRLLPRRSANSARATESCPCQDCPGFVHVVRCVDHHRRPHEDRTTSSKRRYREPPIRSNRVHPRRREAQVGDRHRIQSLKRAEDGSHESASTARFYHSAATRISTTTGRLRILPICRYSQHRPCDSRQYPRETTPFGPQLTTGAPITG